MYLANHDGKSCAICHSIVPTLEQGYRINKNYHLNISLCRDCSDIGLVMCSVGNSIWFERKIGPVNRTRRCVII